MRQLLLVFANVHPDLLVLLAVLVTKEPRDTLRNRGLSRTVTEKAITALLLYAEGTAGKDVFQSSAKRCYCGQTIIFGYSQQPSAEDEGGTLRLRNNTLTRKLIISHDFSWAFYSNLS
uniref:Secreted protein n=1 Tax=Steinernema glaseri TaxID=37863 RepID=A0A1I7Y9Y8_9BILA